MNREQALAFADQVVTAWLADPPKNGRGYVADGWKPPTLDQRTDAVVKMAEFLWAPDPVPSILVAPQREENPCSTTDATSGN